MEESNYTQPTYSAPAPSDASSSPSTATLEPHQDMTKQLLVLSFALVCTVLVESVILVFFGVNFFNRNDDEIPSEEISLVSTEDGMYTFDDLDNIASFSLKCTNEDDSVQFSFDKNMTYVKNIPLQPTETGTYSIINNQVIVLNPNNGSERTVYYNGASIIEGASFYDCE